MLEFKKISDDTASFMKEAVGSDVDYYERAVDSINVLIPSSNIHVLNSANSCIIALCKSIPEPVLVCDQGGWNGFVRSCELFDKVVEYITTDDGLINIEVLDDYLNSHDVKSLYITSLAGYTAVQPLMKIHDLCRLHDVLLIVDVSGTVGDERFSDVGDVQIASTGSPKIVNIENGGFICDITGKITLNKHMLKSMRADNVTCAGITNEITKSTQILEKTIRMNRYLKDKLKEHVTVIHPEYYALNTIVPVQSKGKAKKIAYAIRQEVNMDGNIISVGPSYNRVKKPCIIIEIKNLNINVLEKEDLDYLADIVINELAKSNP